MNPTYLGANVYRGVEPSTPEDFDYLKRLCITDIVDLEARPFDLSGAHREFQTAHALRCGMRLWPIPIMPIFPPHQSQVILALRIMGKYKVDGDSAIYVHCKQGVDRTGFVCAAYRVREQHIEEDAAIAEMWDMGFHQRYGWWIPYFRKFLRDTP